MVRKSGKLVFSFFSPFYFRFVKTEIYEITENKMEFELSLILGRKKSGNKTDSGLSVIFKRNTKWKKKRKMMQIYLQPSWSDGITRNLS